MPVTVGQRAEIIPLKRPPASDEELIAGLVRREPQAAAELFDRFQARINKPVWRLLGADAEHDDVVQQVFLQVLASVCTVRNAQALSDFVHSVTVNTVRKEIRSRKYRRMVFAPEPEGLADREPCLADVEDKAMVSRFYGVLGRMKADDRIVFTLRYVDQSTLGEVAKVCGFSLATAKRKLARAEKAFRRLAKSDSMLSHRFEELTHGD